MERGIHPPEGLWCNDEPEDTVARPCQAGGSEVGFVQPTWVRAVPLWLVVRLGILVADAWGVGVTVEHLLHDVVLIGTSPGPVQPHTPPSNVRSGHLATLQTQGRAGCLSCPCVRQPRGYPTFTDFRSELGLAKQANHSTDPREQIRVTSRMSLYFNLYLLGGPD